LPKELLCPEHDESERNKKPRILPAPAHGESWAQARLKALKLEEKDHDDDEDDVEDEDKKNKTNKRKKRTTTTTTTKSRSSPAKKLKPSIQDATKEEIDIVQAMCHLFIGRNAPSMFCLRKLGASEDSDGEDVVNLMDKLEAINKIVFKNPNHLQSNERTNDQGSGPNDDDRMDDGGTTLRSLIQQVPDDHILGESLARHITESTGRDADDASECPSFHDEDSPTANRFIEFEAAEAGSNEDSGDEERFESREESIPPEPEKNDEGIESVLNRIEPLDFNIIPVDFNISSGSFDWESD
jgi:hypothetical protein